MFVLVGEFLNARELSVGRLLGDELPPVVDGHRLLAVEPGREVLAVENGLRVARVFGVLAASHGSVVEGRSREARELPWNVRLSWLRHAFLAGEEV